MARIVAALIEAVLGMLQMTAAPPPPRRPFVTEPLERKPPLIVPPVTEVEPMGAYRCSQCALNYPQNGKCRSCGGDLSHMPNAKPTPEDELPLDPHYVFKDLTYEERKEWMRDVAKLEERARERGLDSWACLLYGDDTLPPPPEEAV